MHTELEKYFLSSRFLKMSDRQPPYEILGHHPSGSRPQDLPPVQTEQLQDCPPHYTATADVCKDM